jgi:hypothetical protein
VDLNGLVELGELDFLDERHSLFKLVFAGFHLFSGGLIVFAWFMRHVTSLVQAVRFPNRQTNLPLSLTFGTSSSVADRNRPAQLGVVGQVPDLPSAGFV